jgi:hypothetical protein
MYFVLNFQKHVDEYWNSRCILERSLSYHIIHVFIMRLLNKKAYSKSNTHTKSRDTPPFISVRDRPFINTETKTVAGDWLLFRDMMTVESKR